MARVTVEDCLPMVDNRFALVLLATKRTRQLMAGARPLMANMKNKPPVLSLREIATGQGPVRPLRARRPLRQVRQGEGDDPCRPDADAALSEPIAFVEPRARPQRRALSIERGHSHPGPLAYCRRVPRYASFSPPPRRYVRRSSRRSPSMSASSTNRPSSQRAYPPPSRFASS